MLRWEKERLEVIRHNRNLQTHHAWASPFVSISGIGGSSTGSGGNITITGGNSWNFQREVPPKMPSWNIFRSTLDRPNGAECCIGCFRFYNPSGAQELDILLSEIDQLKLEVLPPLELLAEAADDESTVPVIQV